MDSDLEKKAIFADFKRLQDWLIKLCNHVPPNKHVRCGPCMQASGLMYALSGVCQLRCRPYAWLNHCAAVGRSSLRACGFSLTLPARRSFSLRATEFSGMVRMFPLHVLVPVKAQLDLRLPASGRPEQAC